MRCVVPAAHHPTVAVDHDVRDRRVVGAGEREAGRAGGDVHDLADHATVHDGDHEFVGMIGGDAPDAAPHTVLELVGGLTAGNHVPALLDEHPLRYRVAVGHPLAELAALPITEEHLAKICEFRGLHFEVFEQRLGGLVRALPLIGDDPFLCVNADNWWTDDGENAFKRLMSAWNDEIMDALMLVVPLACANNTQGQGDFDMDSAGRLAKARLRRGPASRF